MIAYALVAGILSIQAVAAPTAAELATLRAEFSQVLPAMRDALDLELPDYQSARFRDVHVQAKRTSRGQLSLQVCGLINERGPSGGYTGWRLFSLSRMTNFSSGEPIAPVRYKVSGGSTRFGSAVIEENCGTFDALVIEGDQSAQFVASGQ
jgi:hypothetical protein